MALWKPKDDAVTNLGIFMNRVNEKFNLNIETYPQLYQWSIESYPDFWGFVFSHCGIVSSKPYTQVIDKSQKISDFPKFFEGCELNYAQNLLQAPDDDLAICFKGEKFANITTRTFGELKRNVARLRLSLSKLGVQPGDRVVGYVSNCCEAVEAMLATASLGAVWSSMSPDLGSGAVLERFRQITPKVLFSVNAVYYKGRPHNNLQNLSEVIKNLPGLEAIILIPFLPDSPLEIPEVCNKTNVKYWLWLDFLAESPLDSELQFKQVPFDHPLLIMYSSGTTGAPKCIVHSHGGTLIQHKKEHMLHCNMTKNDKLLYYTTTGWMMWNWMLSALATGACIVLYDGSPLLPRFNMLWDLVDELQITILGISAKWLSAVEEQGAKPMQTHKLTSLHTILSTGSPLKPASFDFVYEHVKKDVLLGSITGGTDIISCFAGANPMLPVYKGEIQCRHLGMAVDCWNEKGESMRDENGELVCTKPFPCMPIYFWDDADKSKYKAAYFNKFPETWTHGDFCIIKAETEGIVMLGRSDGTLNPNGVRFGSAEIYNIVESFKQISDSLCIAQMNEETCDERMILFLKLSSTDEMTNDWKHLEASVKSAIQKQLSVRHVPAVIKAVSNIPYTISGKKVEVAIRRILEGKEVTNANALADPACLDEYRSMHDLISFSKKKC